MHDRTGEAHLRLCVSCRRNWADIETEYGALICSACWLEREKKTAPVKEPRKTEK